MPSKYERITALHREMLNTVTADAQEWTGFLSSACMNYKLPFDEQLLVYAQRPDATAVLELKRWNNNFNRWVNLGAKGIAVLSDESATRIKHYFDISDTHEGKYPRPVPIWSMEPEFEPDVIEALEAAFGELADTDTLDSAIVSAVSNAVEDNYADYLDDLSIFAQGDGQVKENLLTAMRSSVAFMVLHRSGYDTRALLTDEDFEALGAFSDPRAVTILGTAVSATAEMALREVATTVLALERESTANRTFARPREPKHTEPQIITERSNDGADIQPDAGGLPATEPERTDGNGAGHRDVGTQAQELPQREPQRALRGDEDGGQFVPALSGDEQPSRGDVDTTGGANGEIAESRQRDEAPRPDALDRTYEQHPSTGDRDSEPRPDLQLDAPPDEPATDITADRAGDEQSPAFSVSGNDRDAYYLPLGTTVYIGTQDYELVTLGDAQVALFDPTAPLFNRLMETDELYQRLIENPLNDHLRKLPGAHEVAIEVADDFDLEAITGTKIDIAGQPSVIGAVRSVKQQDPIDFRITDDDLGHGGTKERYRWNVAAIHALQTLEDENRLATPAEQQILSRYVGWGAIPQAFDGSNLPWASEYTELENLLSPDEFASARATTLNAHYTSPVVIKAIYQAIVNMGYTTGNVLEPACGIGNFLGLVPESMSKSRFFAVEIDPMTARIAHQLYQTADIRCQGFEQSNFPDSFFDVAVGNVPFGNYSISDKRYDKNKFLIHDFFFAKTLDKVRAGGIVAFITSKGTLDKQNPQTRRYLAERADLIGAIRLPNNAFKDNAGTEVTADIIFLQKRDRPQVSEPAWVHLEQTADGLPINSYFADNPEMVLGQMTNSSSLYGRADDTTCEPYPNSNLAEQLEGAIANIHARITDFERDEDEAEQDDSIPADPAVRNFSYALIDNKVYFREDSRMYPQDMSATAKSRVKGLIAIRDSVRELIELQSDDASDEAIGTAQARLNSLYDNYTARYGLITSRGNSMAFAKDSSYPLLASLEDVDENGKLVAKAAMFSKRTIRPYASPVSADTPAEALAVSLSERARVDVAFMAELTGMEQGDITAELAGVIFRVPGAIGENTWQTADEYLSGNVREKLEIARLAAEADPAFVPNVEALEKAIPDDLTAPEISVRLGATWIPTDDIQDFMFELLETQRRLRWSIKVRYAPHTAQWCVEGKSKDTFNVLAQSTYGTRRANAYQIIEDTLNLRDMRIYDYPEDADGKRHAVLNKKETAIALAKQEIIKSKFQTWIWSDPERRERLCRYYNDTFNSMRLREFDGSHLTFPGMNPEIKLNDHQINAVARILYGGNSLLAHVVGAGKTYTMVAATQELKRLGLCNKSLIVVPNHLTEQWASEYLQLYPAANILVATKRDFERKNRRKFTARIATGDYDAVIIGHSQFEKIPLSFEHQQRVLSAEIDDVLDGIAELKAERGDSFTIKQMELSRKKLQTRLDKLNDQSRKDDVINFEELGIDRLFIDESHGFKNLFMFTKMRNVGGVAQSEAQKSSDLFMKCRYLDDKTGAKGVIFATGTPISNSMVELYTVQRYLQYHELQRLDLTHFDCWASTFGETISAVELSPDGTGYRQKTRFSKFYNLPELMALFRQVADIQTADMLNLPVPECDYHNVSVQPTEMQRELVAELGNRADKVRGGMVSSDKDNMLVITNDGRKLALDQRLINPLLPDSPDSKVSVCCDNVFRIWEHHADTRQAQLIFCDLSTPKSDGTFSVYNDIKRKLIAKGVPEAEIAFIHDANTEVRKAELFAKVRSGSVRVLIGSTAKMGAGTNVQDRLIAIHDCDCPWRPSEVGQSLRTVYFSSCFSIFNYRAKR